MPRGARGGSRAQRRGGGGRKGANRHFTNIAEMEAEEEKNKRMTDWRRRQGEMPSDSDEESGSGESDTGEAGGDAGGDEAAQRRPPPSRVPGLDDSSEEESSDEEDMKFKGVGHLIEVQNPNQVQHKEHRKAGDLDKNATVQLTRREREELDKQRAEAHYRKLHLEGKTEEAQSDMARLALVRKQRAEAQAKRDLEKKAKDKEAKEAEKKLMEKRKQARAT